MGGTDRGVRPQLFTFEPHRPGLRAAVTAPAGIEDPRCTNDMDMRIVAAALVAWVVAMAPRSPTQHPDRPLSTPGMSDVPGKLPWRTRQAPKLPKS